MFNSTLPSLSPQTSPHSGPILPPSLVKESFSNKDSAKERRVPEQAQSLPKLYIH